jgi:MFS family permease
MSGQPGRGLPHRRALLVWGTGVAIYLTAVFHRSSLAVAGVAAAHRFGIGAATLALFSVVQLAVYAGMQIPVGVLLDRFGSRRMLLTGGSLMVAGQLAFALVPDVRLAIVARLLIGLGDAMTFISVLRVVARWFPPRRVPMVMQLTSMLGQLGSVASAIPIVLVLRDFGWAPTYLGAAGLGLLALGLVAAALRDGPAGAPVPSAGGGSVRAAWAEPGTRLGMWTHFVTLFSGNVFGLLWGYPFLVDGEGLRPATAALLLTLLTLGMLGGSPLIGHLCGRIPYRRSVLVLVVVGSSALVWSAVLLWPGRAPVWLLVLLVLVLSVNGPGSMIGFDYARTFNPGARLGSASGIVNVGGFTASILLITGVGVVLDAAAPGAGGHYPLSAFRWAFGLQYLLWTVGVVQVLRHRRATRRRLAERDPESLAAMRRGVALLPAEA